MLMEDEERDLIRKYYVRNGFDASNMPLYESKRNGTDVSHMFLLTSMDLR